MATYVEGGTRSRTFSLIALVVVAAILYLARDVLIPLVLAILLSFLLAPAVTPPRALASGSRPGDASSSCCWVSR